MRVKQGAARHQRHLKVRQAAKGMQHGRRRSFRLAKQAVRRALEYAYRDRRVRKRTMRSLWIVRISNALKPHNMSYSHFISLLNKNGVTLDRKILSELAVNESAAFAKLVELISKSNSS